MIWIAGLLSLTIYHASLNTTTQRDWGSGNGAWPSVSTKGLNMDKKTRVTVNFGCTINTGNYQNVTLDFGIEEDVPPGESVGDHKAMLLDQVRTWTQQEARSVRDGKSKKEGSKETCS
jgi:hypothetical protein